MRLHPALPLTMAPLPAVRLGHALTAVLVVPTAPAEAARAGGEIVLTGQTDHQGSLEANDPLSLERGLKHERIDAVGLSERETVVPSDDEVAEPRNRRANRLVH